LLEVFAEKIEQLLCQVRDDVPGNPMMGRLNLLIIENREQKTNLKREDRR
jgi:hypothetical protein